MPVTTAPAPTAPAPRRPRRRRRAARAPATSPSLGRSTSPATRSRPTCATTTIEHHGWYDEAAPWSATAGCSASSDSQQGRDRRLRPPVARRGARPRAARHPRGPRPRAGRRGRPRPTPWFDIGAYRAGRPHPGLAARPRGFEVDDHVHPDADRPRRRPAEPSRPPASDVVGPTDHRRGRPARRARRSTRSPSPSTTATCRSDFDAFRERFTEHGDGLVARSAWPSSTATPVGLLVGTRQFEEDEDAGYVRTLGVAARRPRPRRRQGAAAGLLRRGAAGRPSAVLLHVDVANVTGALRRLRVGRDAPGARDRRVGQARTTTG